MTASPSSPGPQKRLAPEQLLFLQEALAASSALAAADHLGVLARLAVSPANLVTLAHDCAISERGTRLLLAALTSLGLIEEVSDGSYSAAMPSVAHLTALIAPWDQLFKAILTT